MNERVLSNVSKFEEITAETEKDINILLQHESKLIEFLSELKVFLRLIYINKQLNP